LLAFESNRFLILGSTRLIVRARGGQGYHFYGVPWWAAKHVASVIHFIMQRKQLLGIARRAEHSGEKSHAGERKDAA
jgi:hypothetical protein